MLLLVVRLETAGFVDPDKLGSGEQRPRVGFRTEANPAVVVVVVVEVPVMDEISFSRSSGSSSSSSCSSPEIIVVMVGGTDRELDDDDASIIMGGVVTDVDKLCPPSRRGNGRDGSL